MLYACSPFKEEKYIFFVRVITLGNFESYHLIFSRLAENFTSTFY